MGPSEKSFNQVKAILGKLDRNIDQLRERRSTGREATPAATGNRVPGCCVAHDTRLDGEVKALISRAILGTRHQQQLAP